MACDRYTFRAGAKYARSISDLEPLIPGKGTSPTVLPPRRWPRSATTVSLLAGAIVSAAIGLGLGRATAPLAKATTPATLIPATVVQPTVVATTTTRSSTSTTINVNGVAGAFAGTWYRHSTGLTVDPSGYGILDWRIYNDCGSGPPPCDFSAGNNIVDGGHATFRLSATGALLAAGEVEATTDSSTVPIGRFTARLDPSNDLLYLALPLFGALPMCGPDSRQPNECGA
jgi:hypothetical protein